MLTRRCGVLGSPIAHSLSPVMHRAAYAALGLDWRYDAYEVDEAALTGFVAGLDASWRGLSLTMPLKRVVLPLLDDVSETVRETGAANTVLLDEGRLSGDNTDVPGIVAALAERGVSRVTSAVIVGAGATAESTVAALRRIGLVSVRLLVRDPGRAEHLRERAAAAGVAVVVAPLDDAWITDDADLAVSTVPAAALAEHADALAGADAVFDAIYDPWPTPLTEAARAGGRAVVTGVDLLAHQAVRQVSLMTGRDVPVDVLRDPAQAALGSRP
ncbi:MAG TPA: shikimate dehydrogenase [Nocardioidaceae bacterium]|nr:shikimate dehydrogenase [Nocardioidaceae bacterium]